MEKDLIRFKKDTKFLTFDFETECLNLYATKPWQYASVMSTQKEIIEEVNMMIYWEDLNMSEGAEKITRFDYNYWKRLAKSNIESFKKINSDFKSADFICGHNIIFFDVPIYYRKCKELGLEPVNIIDKLIDSRALIMAKKLEISYDKKYNWFNFQVRILHNVIKKRGFATLKAACDYYEVDYDNDLAHDALYDVKVNQKVISKMIYDFDI